MKPRPYLLAAISGAALFFIFPNILKLHLWPLAWVVLAPLLIALGQAQSSRQAAKIAGAAGLFGYPFLYHWLIHTMNHYAGMAYPVCFFVLMGLVLILSLYLVGFGAAYHVLVRDLKLSPLIAAPLAWTAFEYLRGHFPFGGFPWALMAYSQFPFLPVCQISELTGPYGLSSIILAANAATAALVSRTFGARLLGMRVSLPAHSFAHISLALAPLMLALIYGFIRMPLVDRAFEKQPRLTVGVVQANIDQGIKWDVDFFWKTLEEHLALTRGLMKDHPRLVIWPEAAVTAPGGLNQNWTHRTPVIDELAKVTTYFLTGSLTVEDCGDPGPGRSRCAKNSVYLLTPGAESITGRYDKIHLVPFGEYVPLAKLLFFADAIAKGNTGSTTAGAEVKIFSMPGAHFGCVICYEVIFPELVRRFVNDGAGFMTTVTNDAWFGKTGAPYQHHANVVFRAIENRVFFVRAANTGVSSIVDPNGRILHQSGIYEPAAFTGEVQSSPLKTFYTKFGDVFAWTNSAAFLVLLAAGFYFRRRARSENA